MQRQLHVGMGYRLGKELGIFFKQPMGNGIGVIHDDTVCLFAAKRLVDISYQLRSRGGSVRGRLDSERIAQRGANGFQGFRIDLIWHNCILLYEKSMV